MPGYGASDDMATLLAAMKDQPQQESTKLKYLRQVTITSNTLGPLDAEPAIFLVPTGSPEEVLGEHNITKIFVATHEVDVNCVVSTASPWTDDRLLGTGKEIGLLPFVADVLDFYGNNLLGLSGINTQDKPTIQAPSGAFVVVPTDDEEVFWLVATLKYAAKTKPFSRT